MKFTKQKIRELILEGDHETLLHLIFTLQKRVAAKTALLLRQADIAANLRHAYMETELDRDRLQRMSVALCEFCRVQGFGEGAEEITERYGGVTASSRQKVIG